MTDTLWERRKPSIPSGPGSWGKWHLWRGETPICRTNFPAPETASGYQSEQAGMWDRPMTGKVCAKCNAIFERTPKGWTS